MCLTTSTATIIIMKHKIRDCNTLFIICYQHTNSIIARTTYKQQLTRQQQQQNQHTNNQSKTSTRATTVPIINVCLAHEQQQQIQHTSNNSKIRTRVTKANLKHQQPKQNQLAVSLWFSSSFSSQSLAHHWSELVTVSHLGGERSFLIGWGFTRLGRPREPIRLPPPG